MHDLNAPVHIEDMAGKNLRRIVAELLAASGDNQTELANKLGVTQPQVSRWLAGAEPKQSSIVRILALARQLGVVQSTEHYPYQNGTVDVVGYVGAGGQVVFAEGQGPFERVESPPNTTPTMVALRVQGDSMSPMIGDGWLIYYDDRETAPEIVTGKPYVVGLEDGRVLVKKLAPGRRKGCYDLYSVNAEPMLDQAVSWVARVKAIIP